MRAPLIALFVSAVPVAGVACPDWEAQPYYGDVSLKAGFAPDPHRVELLAGGANVLGDCGFEAAGFVGTPPDFDLYWSGKSSRLRIGVISDADTVLLVNGPDGSWYYSDDDEGHNPIVVLNNPEEGLYDIWVGSYNANAYSDAVLLITER